MLEGRKARARAIGLAALAATILIGAAGGAGAGLAGLPIPFLLGSLIVTAVLALAGVKPLGRAAYVPPQLRSLAMSVIGVSIGGTITPQVAGQITNWAPTLLVLLVFLPVTQAAGYGLFRLGGIPRAEAWFGSVPGGVIESVQMAEEAGVETRTVMVLQFLRLILSVMAVPLIFMAVTGNAVGSAAGVQLPGATDDAGLPRLAALLALGGLGAWGAGRLGLPAAPMLGPMLLSALAHGFDMPLSHPPGWLIGATQVVIGCALGARFAGIPRSALFRAAGLAVANTALSLSIALMFALGLRPWTDQSLQAVFLAYAPGGLAEMSLVALSLHIEVVFVSIHHLARISLAVMTARFGAAFLKRRPG
ncbi:AbrB family transcriptional regulator [Arvimicrobium flavum]|uniref:AbrB family transcriptional regulator n=1 Tax=Arvimicrobium flavum TaxID=3393320 RepID=UPI00237A3908|nr:AbrB family transcriptional regulator [Mesorhizobium shangrilense]